MALSRDDVRKHLEDLGYFNVSDDLLDVFAKGKKVSLFCHHGSWFLRYQQ